MQTLPELSEWVRNFGHDPRQMSRLILNRFTWHQIWTAMDIIDDIDLAMAAYVDNEFPADIGERYLRIYGILQALYVQQDALRDLIRAIHPAKVIEVSDLLKDIRGARNASVGHPTQLRRKGESLSAHGIVRATMSKEGFELCSFPEKDGKFFVYVPVRELIQKQRAEATRILSEVVAELLEQEEAHRAEFRHNKLIRAFDQVFYAFEKILEEFQGCSLPTLGQWGIDHLFNSICKFEELLKERGLSIDSYDSVKYLYEEIEHPLNELRKFLRGETSEVLSHKSAVVFANALMPSFEKLVHIASEIDEEYAAVPKLG